MTESLQQRIDRHAQGVPLEEGFDALSRKLASPHTPRSKIIDTDGKAIVLDLSSKSRMFGQSLRGAGVDLLGELIDDAMRAAGTGYAFGRYAEVRELYSNENFKNPDSNESRTVHMGIDLFCEAGTIVKAPLDAELAIIANNQVELDYGPMLVLKHAIDGHAFYSLYGHLDLDSISHLENGQTLRAGERIAAVGSPPENGNWPAHLHFQLILDLLGLGKDFPGVAYRSQRSFWLAMSPSPAAFFPDCAAALLQAE
jgi:murein DD-endopeptidase MepM/ murein hydrolase activator NlpD